MHKSSLAAALAVASALAACPRPVPSPPAEIDAGTSGSSGNAGADAGADGGTLAASAGPEDLSAALEPYRADAGMPALASAAFRGSTLLGIGVTGVRKLGSPTPATVNDQWHLGSDTKAMTATLIGVYVDQGLVRFDDTIARLFPGEAIDPGYREVTLDQLLQHRGGLPHDVPPDIWGAMWADGAKPEARLKAVRALLARPPAQAPGTFVYANAGYIVAGAALERAAKDTWENLILRRLWMPLGMTSCGFGAPGTPGGSDEPWGHKTQPDGTLEPFDPARQGSDNPPSLGPAGTAHCTLADWGKFLALHLAGARGEPGTLVSTQTLKHLQTPPPGGEYAAGWFVVPRKWAGGDGTTLDHTGSNTLWLANTWLAPAKNLAMMTVTNCANPKAEAVVDQTFGMMIGRYAK
ncbi:MAG: beta-lactamase family protein [Deltaproteobacteria bacterium]|nr:beta-lactamase family protein [Deltaproteobacteria bacterium]